jgi:hypothetical protein
MLSRLTYTAVALVLGFGIAGAAAAENDHQLLSGSDAKTLAEPLGGGAGGFSAIRESKPNAGQEEHSLQSGRTFDELSGVALESSAFASNSQAMLDAQRQGVGGHGKGNGFAALKTAAGQHGPTDPQLRRLIMSAAKAGPGNSVEAFK